MDDDDWNEDPRRTAWELLKDAAQLQAEEAANEDFTTAEQQQIGQLLVERMRAIPGHLGQDV